MFRVLYPMDSEYGLQIISDKNIQNVTLGGSTWEEGKASYNGAIETLNNEAGKYVNREYAYDGRCVGSIPTVKNGVFVNKNRVRDSEKNIKDKLSTVILPPSEWTSYTRPTGWTSNDTGCYDSDTNYTVDETALEGANIWTTGQYYWLASRSVYSYSDSSSTNFVVRRVDTSGYLHSSGVCSVYSDGRAYGRSYTGGLRPCVSLKSDIIRIIGGNGLREDTAYTIGK